MNPHRLRSGLLLALVLPIAAGCVHQAPPRADWSPDSIPEAYRRSVAALMWPGTTRSFQVTGDGDLYNGAWYVRVRPEANGVPAPAPAVVAYEDRWCPVVRWTRTSGDIRWEFEAVALPEPAPPFLGPRGPLARHAAAWSKRSERRETDAAIASYAPNRIDSLLLRVRRPLERDPSDRLGLIVSLRVRGVNTGASEATARLDLEFESPARSLTYRCPDSLVRTTWETGWGAESEVDSVLGWCAGAGRGSRLRREWRLPARGDREERFVLPAYPMPQRDLAAWARRDHERRVAEVRSFWRGEVARGATFDLPDPEVRDALRAARVVLLSLRERRGEVWAPIGGPFHYRDVWLRDGARAMQALALAGYTREAREMARGFLEFQWPNGPFVSQTGQLDGTGQALWAFDQVLSRPAPSPDVPRFARAALRACEALERQRAATIGTDGHFAGLLPATNPNDNELVLAQLVGNDAWALAGYRATERMLRAAGMPERAATVSAAHDRYRRTFEQRLIASGRDDVPPSWQGEGIDWGNLAVAYPCEVVAAGDPRIERLARRYWSAVGGAGPGYYNNPDSLHGYVAADLGTWALLAGRPAIADSVLRGLLEWRSASGGVGEIYTRSGRDFGVNYPPHPTSAAALIALVRNSLVFDDADTLQLTLGARPAWWRGSRLRDVPTRWGLLDLEFRRRAGAAEWRWSRVPVWTALTLPPGRRPAGTLPSDWRKGPRANVVLVPPGTTRARIALAPELATALSD